MNTNQNIERAVGNARTITENGYNLDRLVEFISSEDSPKSIAQRILTANFEFIDLLTSAENVDTVSFNNSFFILREMFEVFNEMEQNANQGVIIVVPKTEIQRNDELQTTKDNNANEEIRGLRIRYDAVWDLYEDGKAEIKCLNERLTDKDTAVDLQDRIIKELKNTVDALKSQLQEANSPT